MIHLLWQKQIRLNFRVKEKYAVKLSDGASQDGLFCDGDWIEKKDQDPNGAVRLIQLADIGVCEFKDKSSRYITEDKGIELNCTYLQKGDILIARLPEPLGRACIFPFEGKYITAVDIAIVRILRKGINPKYVMYMINSPQFRNEIKKYESGTTRKRISRKNLDRIDFDVPPLPEQECIVTRIEELFSQLDSGAETLKKIKRQLAVYRQAAVTAAYPTLTEENTCCLSELAEISGGITKGRRFEGSETVFLPYLRVANVQNGYLDLTEIKEIQLKKSEIEQYLMHFGDVLYTEGGDRDKLGRGTIWRDEIENCVHQNHVFKARIDAEKALSLYVAYWSMTTPARNYFYTKGKQSVNLASINKTVLSMLPIPLAPLDQQNNIVAEIESKLSVCDIIEKTVDTALQQAEAMRQSILKRAFEGGLL